jgi:hypothetical protein
MHNQAERFYIYCVCCGKNKHEAKTCRNSWEKIKDKHEQKEEKGKAHEFSHLVVAHCNIGINEDLFKALFDYWRDA